MALAAVCFAVGVTSGFAAFGDHSAPRRHGVASVFFPPWLSEAEASARIHRAGGVAIAEPGAPAGRIGLFQAIAAGADFASRARAEGALFIFY